MFMYYCDNFTSVESNYGQKTIRNNEKSIRSVISTAPMPPIKMTTEDIGEENSSLTKIYSGSNAKGEKDTIGVFYLEKQVSDRNSSRIFLLIMK